MKEGVELTELLTLHITRSRNLLRIYLLTLPVPIPEEEKKLIYYFIFTLLCGASKDFMKAKGLHKTF